MADLLVIEPREGSNGKVASHKWYSDDIKLSNQTHMRPKDEDIINKNNIYLVET